MSYYCYVIEYADGRSVYLSEEGPREELPDFQTKLSRRGFQVEDDFPLIDGVLRVYKRTMPATDIVPENEEEPALP